MPPRRSAASRCAASISATTGWCCPRSACRPGRSASTTAGATTRARPTYNRLVRIPNEWSHEKMWREDGLYDLRGGGRLQRRSARGRMGQRDLPAHRPRRHEPDPGLRRLRARRSARAGAADRAADPAATSCRRRPPKTAPPAGDDDDMKQFEDFDETGLVERVQTRLADHPSDRARRCSRPAG